MTRFVTPVHAELLRRVTTLEQRLKAAMARRVLHLRDRLRRVRLLHPRQRVERGRLRLDELQERLGEAATRSLVFRRARLEALSRQIEVLSPLAVLERGYAIVAKDGVPVVDAEVLAAGDRLDVRLAKGRVGVVVE